MPLPKEWLASFQKLSPSEQHQYLLDTDTSYKSFSPKEQQDYRTYLSGSATPSAPTLAMLAASKERNTKPTQFEKDNPSSFSANLTQNFSKLPEGGVSSAGRTVSSALGTLGTLLNPMTYIHAAADKPNPQEAQDYPGVVGRIALPGERMIAAPIRNAAQWYGNAAKGKIQDPVGQALSVAPEALGVGTAAALTGKLAPKIAGGAVDAAQNYFSRIPREQAANMIADAVLPDARFRPQFVQNLIDHWDKITSFADDRGIKLNSTKNLLQATAGASDALQSHFKNLLEPYRAKVLDPANPSFTLGDAHQRLVDINSKLLPAYEKGAGGIDPAQNVKAMEDLNNEAGWLRSKLYPALSESTGIPVDRLQDLNEGSGALRNASQKIQLGNSRAANNAAKAGQEPVSVSPFGGKKFVLDKAANYGLTKLGLTTDPDSLVTRAFKNTPTTPYVPPDSPLTPMPNQSAPLGQIPVAPKPPQSIALASAKTPKATPQTDIDSAQHLVDISQPPPEANYADPSRAVPYSGFGQIPPDNSPAVDPLSPAGPRMPVLIRKALQPSPVSQYLPPSSLETQ